MSLPFAQKPMALALLSLGLCHVATAQAQEENQYQGKAVVNVSPLQAMVGSEVTFTVSGAPASMVIDLAGEVCGNDRKPAANKVSCKVSKAGSNTLTVKDKPGAQGGVALARFTFTGTQPSAVKPPVAAPAPAPVVVAPPAPAPVARVTGVTPLSGNVGQDITFAVQGQNLPSTLVIDLAGEQCFNDQKPSAYQVRCRVSKAGSNTLTVKDKPGTQGGQALAKYTFTGNQVVQPAPVQPAKPPVATAPAPSPASSQPALPASVAADPHGMWKGWQEGNARVNTPQLRDGKASTLSPAEIIYYSSLENHTNPVLTLAKLQGEQGLVRGSFSGSELIGRLELATGYGARIGSKWYGFYPQVVGMTYQFDRFQKEGKRFSDAYQTYTQDSRGPFSSFQTIYADYAQAMNRIAGTNYAPSPSDNGYYRDFSNITPQHIQAFLQQMGGALSNSKLFGGPGIIAAPVASPVPVTPVVTPATSAMSVASVTPLSAPVGQNVTFTVNGSNLPSTLVINLSGEECYNDKKPSPFQVVCKVSKEGRNDVLQVKDKSGGTVLKTFSFTGTASAATPPVSGNLQPWQQQSLNYAAQYLRDYGSRPLTNVAGNACGQYTFCYAFARSAPGINLPGGMGTAQNAFNTLRDQGRATSSTDFAKVPLGAVVFYAASAANGQAGHAAIKVDAENVVSQGQLGARDCTITSRPSSKLGTMIGYYAPSAGASTIDPNVILPELRISRQDFANKLNVLLSQMDKTLPADSKAKMQQMGIVSNVATLNADPTIRQDAGRMLDRIVSWYESKGWKFNIAPDTRFDRDPTIADDFRSTARRLAGLGLFQGVLDEDGSFKYFGQRQLRVNEADIVISRLASVLNSAQKPTASQPVAPAVVTAPVVQRPPAVQPVPATVVAPQTEILPVVTPSLPVAAPAEPAVQPPVADNGLNNTGPLAISVSNPSPSVGEKVYVNLSGGLPAGAVDIYLFVKVEQLGGQIAWYYERRLNDTGAKPWRANIQGPNLPETNPVFSYKVNQPGRYAVGILVLPAGSPVSMGNRIEAVFEAR